MNKEFDQSIFASTFNKHKKLLKESLSGKNNADEIISVLKKKLPSWTFEKTGKGNDVQCNVPVNDTASIPRGTTNNSTYNELNRWAVIKGTNPRSYIIDKLRDTNEPGRSFETDVLAKVRSNEPHLELNETLSARGIEIIDKWRGAGDREAAVKLVDYALKKLVGLSSSDLADTKIFMDGLDKIEILLAAKKYEIALKQANVTAKKMLKDEGADFLENSNKLNENMKNTDYTDYTIEIEGDVTIDGICTSEDLLSVELDIEYEYDAGSPEIGRYGPPEDAEQGYAPSVSIGDWRIKRASIQTPSGETPDINLNTLTPIQSKQLNAAVDKYVESKRSNIEDEILNNLDMTEGEVKKPKKPDYGDQLRMAYNKARKEKNVEAIVYYKKLMASDSVASVPFEKFKGSWAYGEWIKKPSTKKDIEDVKADIKRFSYMNEKNYTKEMWIGMKTEQLKEAELKLDKISNSERNKIHNEFKKLGVDGNGRFGNVSKGISVVSTALDNVGFDLDMVTGDILLGDKGSRMLPYRRKNVGQENPEIKNSRIVFNWYKDASGYEIQCYAS
jgi:hypothetical protein